MSYDKWVEDESRKQKRDVSKDASDYDMRAYYASLNQSTKDAGHYPDNYKLPNHPTFSDQSIHSVPVIQQGGTWDETGFTPGPANTKNLEWLQRYFNDVESPEALKIPYDQALSKQRKR